MPPIGIISKNNEVSDIGFPDGTTVNALGPIIDLEKIDVYGSDINFHVDTAYRIDQLNSPDLIKIELGSKGRIVNIDFNSATLKIEYAIKTGELDQSRSQETRYALEYFQLQASKIGLYVLANALDSNFTELEGKVILPKASNPYPKDGFEDLIIDVALNNDSKQIYSVAWAKPLDFRVLLEDGQSISRPDLVRIFAGAMGSVQGMTIELLQSIQ